MARTRGSSLIKRYSLPYTTRELTTSVPSEDNPFSNTGVEYLFIRGVLEMCTVQAVSGFEISTLPNGVRDKELYTIYTNTSMHPALENTHILSDAVYLGDEFFSVAGMGGWFSVIKTKVRLNNVVNHYEIVVAKDYNPISNEGISQYPSTAEIDALITSKADFIDRDVWETQWVGANV